MTDQMDIVAGKIRAGCDINRELRAEINKLIELSDAIEKAHDAMLKSEAQGSVGYAGRGQSIKDRDIPDGIKPKEMFPTLVNNGDE